MARAYLDVTPTLIVEFLKGLKEGDAPRSFLVKDPLPEDATLVGMSEWINNTIRIEIESESVDHMSQLNPLLETRLETAVGVKGNA